MMAQTDRCSTCTYFKQDTRHTRDCVAGLREQVDDRARHISVLSAQVIGLQEDIRAQQREIVKLRQENIEIRFNWIAAVEGIDLERGDGY